MKHTEYMNCNPETMDEFAPRLVDLHCHRRGAIGRMKIGFIFRMDNPCISV
jgi:hypothetical protein